MIPRVFGFKRLQNPDTLLVRVDGFARVSGEGESVAEVIVAGGLVTAFRFVAGGEFLRNREGFAYGS